MGDQGDKFSPLFYKSIFFLPINYIQQIESELINMQLYADYIVYVINLFAFPNESKSMIMFNQNYGM